MDETLTVAIEADTTGFETALKSLERQASSFGTTLTGALKGAMVSGRSLEDTLRAIGQNFSRERAECRSRAVAEFAERLCLAGVLRIFRRAALPFAQGGVVGADAMFAGGGVLAAPAYFPLWRRSDRIGRRSRAGGDPALSRGPDGRLGVAAGEGGAPVMVNVTINTPDANSFRKSEAQVSAALARAVARGRRAN